MRRLAMPIIIFATGENPFYAILVKIVKGFNNQLNNAQKIYYKEE